MRLITVQHGELTLRFGGAPPPPVQAPPPPPPTPTDTNAAAAVDARRQAAARAMGRASTILTSGLGAAGTPQLGKKQLLGG